MRLLKPTVLAIFLTVCAVEQWRLMGQKDIEPMLGREGPFGEKISPSQEEETTARFSVIPINEAGIAGSLSIYLMRDPSLETFSKGVSGEDRYLGLFLDGDEWGALFFDVLACPDPNATPLLPNEDRAKWEQNYSLIF